MERNISSFKLYIVAIMVSCTVFLQAKELSLNVGLYPYVPRVKQFQNAILEAWKQKYPEVQLVFNTKWDGGYDMTPPDDLDVFVFDAMMFEAFKKRGYLEPLKGSEINDIEDFVDYAIKGVKAEDNYYAVPQLGCASILFYKKDDTQIAVAKDIASLKNVLGECTYTSQIPPNSKTGMMIDLEGRSTNASYYLDIQHSKNGVYPLVLPKDKQELNNNVIASMKNLMKISSYENATDDPVEAYGRAAWFSQGYGRVLVGYTEHMSAMSPQMRKKISFKPLPMSNNGFQPFFYSDVIGVNTKTNSRGVRDLAVELANLMASSETMIKSIGADGNNPYPQYLMAARHSVFKTIGKNFPIYNEMYKMVEVNNPMMFKLPSDSISWFTNMKNVIRADVRENYSCGCDYPTSEPILNNSYAKDICVSTCSKYGGWSGQWTNQFPMASSGKSVCGCNSCVSQ